MYLIRLDDASEERDIEKWDRIEALLDKYAIKPLVGVIPHNEDESMQDYGIDECFWKRIEAWSEKGWTIAIHGYNHKFITKDGGINPVNMRSEFAGVPLDAQIEKISNALKIFKEHNITPKVFFAPAHTFDENTLKALKQMSDIRIISDTISNKPYCKDGFTFIPQQSGKARKLPFHTVTFCYHPNIMSENDFEELEAFVLQNRAKFKDYEAKETTRKQSIVDRLLRKLYFMRRKK